MVYASHVPQSVHPAREIPLTVWAVRHNICCWITPACHTVRTAITPERQIAITVQLTVKSAIKTAYVRVSTLGGAVNKSRVMEDVERIKEMFWTVTQFSIGEEEEEDEEVMQTA